jgi:hypothetical protein
MLKYSTTSKNNKMADSHSDSKYLRCGIDPCASYCPGSSASCDYDGEFKSVSKGEICVHKREKPVNPLHDDQGYPINHEESPARRELTRMEARKYIDEHGRQYSVERKQCFAVLGGISEKVYIVYEDGSGAIITEAIHKTHSKLEDHAQSPPKSGLDETTKNSMSTHNFMQECYRHQPAR